MSKENFIIKEVMISRSVIEEENYVVVELIFPPVCNNFQFLDSVYIYLELEDIKKKTREITGVDLFGFRCRLDIKSLLYDVETGTCLKGIKYRTRGYYDGDWRTLEYTFPNED